MLRIKSFLNNRGVTMVEALVGGAMTAIVSLGVATMMSNSVQEQRKAQLLETLRQRKGQFEALIRDQNVWNNMIAQNSGAPYTTLAGSSQTTAAISDSTPVKIKLYGNSGSTVTFDPLGPDDTGGPFSGFTEKGGSCQNFYTNGNANANDDCPISYRGLISVSCASGTSCMNPQLKVVYRLVFSPKANGTLAGMVNFINPVAGKDLASNPGKYDVVVQRTATGVNRAFRMVAGIAPTAGDCTSANYDGNGGWNTCTTATSPLSAHPIPRNRGYSRTANGGYDPYNLVTLGALGGANAGQWQFAEAGYYGCLVTAPIFSTGGFTLQMYNVTGNIQVAAAKISAGQWASATAVLDTKFNVQNNTDWYEIRQACDGVPAGSPSAANCSLGLTSQYVSSPGSFFSSVTISCYKLDKAM